MNIDEEAYLAHYGILRKSGRYPWGSGGNVSGSGPRTFLETVAHLRKSGMSEKQIAEGMGMTTTQLRAAKSIENAKQKQSQIGEAQRLQNKGYSNVAIGKRMGLNESSVRALLSPGQKDKADVIQSTAAMLREQVASKRMLDVGAGVERYLGVSKEKLGTAVAVLTAEGYKVHYVKIEQLGTGKMTTHKVLAEPGMTYSEVFRNKGNIGTITESSDTGGRSWAAIQPPLSVSSKRIQVRYAGDGGAAADGMIYVRPGVPDVSLGNARYAQVRVKVDGTHYLKGMAVYRDDLPAGVDLVFNTNKHDTGKKTDAMKSLKTDKASGNEADNPFGSTVRQITDPKTGKVTSSMNKVNEEGNWDTWSRSLSSQFLSKQSPKLAQSQLSMVQDRKRRELDEIKGLTNPAVKKKLLDEFADSADSASVHLKAASLPRQSNHVILPISSLKENEIFAPTFNNGERVVLIRHPHGGVFEIPELTVNNRNPEARKLIGSSSLDAVGINHKVAQKLSGADFDGDTVIVIPNNSGKVKTAPALDGLKGFDPQASYPKHPGMKVMTPRTKQFEMGDISNLITDMTIRGASTTELARAVRHSMVVIDAEKHELNYKQSALDNGISQLKAKYQGTKDAGASTLISKASSRLDVAARKPRPAAQGGPVDKATGKKVFVPTGESFTNKQGKLVIKTERSTKLGETHDANTLLSKDGGVLIERIYADHSNALKAMANEARLASAHTKPVAYSPSAKTTYAKEVASLNHKLDVALRNAPRERHAQVLANAQVSLKRQADPNMDPADLKRIKSQALTEARIRTEAHKDRIVITDSEWAAIQAGAISNHKLTEILRNADPNQVKQLATPKADVLMTPAKKQRAASMLASGYTQAEVAAHLGVSLTTLKTSIN